MTSESNYESTVQFYNSPALRGRFVIRGVSQWKDTIVVARDGTGDYRTLTEAMEGIRAFYGL